MKLFTLSPISNKMTSPEKIIHQINTIKDERNKIIEQSNILKEKTNEYNNAIKQLQKQLYEACPHDWEIDRTNIGEHTEYICKKCQLDKDNYYYLR